MTGGGEAQLEFRFHDVVQILGNDRGWLILKEKAAPPDWNPPACLQFQSRGSETLPSTTLETPRALRIRRGHPSLPQFPAATVVRCLRLRISGAYLSCATRAPFSVTDIVTNHGRSSAFSTMQCPSARLGAPDRRALLNPIRHQRRNAERLRRDPIRQRGTRNEPRDSVVGIIHFSGLDEGWESRGLVHVR